MLCWIFATGLPEPATSMSLPTIIYVYYSLNSLEGVTMGTYTQKGGIIGFTKGDTWS